MRRENDFLLRLIQELASVIHYALGLARDKKYDLARETLDQAAGDVLGLTLHSVTQLGAESVVSTLQLQERAAWQAKTAVLAWLLKEDGDMFFAEKDEELGYGRLLTALHLLLALSAADWEPGDDIPTVDELRHSLADFVLPAATYRHLIGHYERQGAYAAAEDVLYNWLEYRETAALTGNNSDLSDPIAAGAAFYQRLLQKEDDALLSGNLPRAEIETGLAELINQ